MLALRIDLGIRSLVKEWHALFSPRYLTNDIVAAMIVACVAIPLSLAIALASGVPPEAGLITAIIAGIVCALLGGTPLAVSGPAAAMAILIASVVKDFGLGGLLVVGFGCGLLQLLTGFLGLGTLIRFVPMPVVMGFTAGIGAIILIGQLPRIFGLPAPDAADVFSVLTHIGDMLRQAQPASFLLAMSTLAITLFLPRLLPRLPAPLFAVIIPATAAYLLHLNVATIGTIPNSLPLPKLPTVPAGSDWLRLFTTSLVVYTLASLETLLSSGAVDQLTKGKEHDSNQELIGQGIGNMVVALFGGIPVTAVIARSALNVQAGAKTRRAAIFHSLILLLVVYCFAHLMSQIPISVLAGILISVALRMCHPREFLLLWNNARTEAAIYVVTFLMIVCLGLMVGIQIGVAAALILAAIRLSQVKLAVHASEYGPAQITVEGPLTFLSAAKFHSFAQTILVQTFPRGLIFDLTSTTALDASGANQLIQLVNKLTAQKIKVALYGLDVAYKATLLITEQSPEHHIEQLFVENETEVHKILGTVGVNNDLNRLMYGVEKFKRHLHVNHKKLFTKLAAVQEPHTLFITCSDSRIDPNLITSTQPGELFIVRDVGNIIPAYSKDDTTPAEGAAVEFAVGVLGVKHIIVCAHSGCGAIKALLDGTIFAPENRAKFPSLVSWLSSFHDLNANLTKPLTIEQAAKLNACLQFGNLKTYPIVQEKIAKGELELQAWFYDIGAAGLEKWDEVLDEFVPIGAQERITDVEKRIEAGIQYQVPIINSRGVNKS